MKTELTIGDKVIYKGSTGEPNDEFADKDNDNLKVGEEYEVESVDSISVQLKGKQYWHFFECFTKSDTADVNAKYEHFKNKVGE